MIRVVFSYWTRFMQVVPGLISAIALVLMTTIYRDDTPQALLARGRTTAAISILNKIYNNSEEAEHHLEALSEQMHREAGDHKGSGFFSAMNQPGCITALIVGCVLSFGQQAGKKMRRCGRVQNPSLVSSLNGYHWLGILLIFMFCRRDKCLRCTLNKDIRGLGDGSF